MSYKKIQLFKETFVNISNVDFAWSNVRLILLVVTVLFCATLCGCSTYDKDVTWVESLYGREPEICNPNFIFDNSPRYAGALQVSAEDFYRRPWPVAPMRYGTINTGEIMSYYESYSSDQYQNGGSRPRNRYHRRVYGHRQEQFFRQN